MPQLIVASNAKQKSSNHEFNDWIDRELVRHAESTHVVAPENLDDLLELRDLISRHKSMDAATVVRAYFRLRSRLEGNFYLLCYRLRAWVAVNYQLAVCDPLGRSTAQEMALDLSRRSFKSLLDTVRRDYFEQADVCLDWQDIRIQIVKKS